MCVIWTESCRETKNGKKRKGFFKDVYSNASSFSFPVTLYEYIRPSFQEEPALLQHANYYTAMQ